MTASLTGVCLSPAVVPVGHGSCVRVQTLFNPNKTVVKMFVVMYDLEDMPPNSQTVIRQRTVYVPVDPNSDLPCYLRYLIHLRLVHLSLMNASYTSGLHICP